MENYCSTHHLNRDPAHGALLRQRVDLQAAFPAHPPVPARKHGRRVVVLEADLTRVLSGGPHILLRRDRA